METTDKQLTPQGEGKREPVQPVSDKFSESIEEEISLAGGKFEEGPEFAGAIGRTMYDSPNSKDNTVTVLLPTDGIAKVPAQSLVRIMSRLKEKGGDGRQYLGAVVQGPFAEPDGLRADAPLVVTTTVRGTMFMPRYHGRIQVEILAEESDGTMVPPRFRPLPNSPVFALGKQETIEKLNLIGDLNIGLAVGFEDMNVFVPIRKDVLPRHMGILGTTGGGKSTTVSRLIKEMSEKGVSVVIFDTEGEYTHIMEPASDPKMKAILEKHGMLPDGVKKVMLYHLIGRETTNEAFKDNKTFCLEFSNLSPYAVMEILGLNDAQQERYLKAYDIAKQVLISLTIFPSNEAEKNELLELDEMESGYPRLTLQMMYDIVRFCADTVGDETQPTYLGTPAFHENREKIKTIITQSKLQSHIWSWRKVQGSLARLLRLKIFDNNATALPDYAAMTQNGYVNVIDLSDTDSPQINNLVISEILRGVMVQQEINYEFAVGTDQPTPKVMIVVEEAHEFLSAERIKQMPVIFQQVARIARRGRKRWLGLMFVTQLPQHLPDEILGLINNYILHKITDANVISRLKKTVGGIDDSLWDRLPNLAPGQAIVSMTSMSRPLLVAIHPTPCKLRMVD
jgi:DNA helicase HerA-like ATPase